MGRSVMKNRYSENLSCSVRTFPINTFMPTAAKRNAEQYMTGIAVS